MNPQKPRHPTLNSNKGRTAGPRSFTHTLSLSMTSPCGPRHGMHPPGPISNKHFFQNSLIVVAEVHLAIIVRTTRPSPATTLSPVGEMSLGASQKVSWTQVSAPGIPLGCPALLPIGWAWPRHRHTPTHTWPSLSRSTHPLSRAGKGAHTCIWEMLTWVRFHNDESLPFGSVSCYFYWTYALYLVKFILWKLKHKRILL